MSETILTISEERAVADVFIGNYLTVTSYCEAIGILDIQDTRICLEVSINTASASLTINLTKSQALKLAEEIQNVYDKSPQ